MKKQTAEDIEAEKIDRVRGLFFLLIIFLAIFVIDWSFLKGGITAYSIFCPPDYTEGNGCYELGRTTYYPNKNKQEVIYKDEYSIETLSKCTVLNRRNWECKWDDESAVFGFNGGKFESTTLRSSFTEDFVELMEMDRQERSVSRFIYILELWNII